MAKKGKKFETEAEQAAQALNQATLPVQRPPVVEGPPAENDEQKVARGFHLVCETADINGRTEYRFAKYSQMPKRAPRMHVIVDGKETEMAVTNSGGYSELKGFNGYIQDARGFTGWILFGDHVDPQSEEQFPNGLVFATKDGSCPANPVRIPANEAGEKKRREAAAAAAKKRAADKAAAQPDETVEDTETEEAEAE